MHDCTFWRKTCWWFMTGFSLTPFYDACFHLSKINFCFKTSFDIRVLLVLRQVLRQKKNISPFSVIVAIFFGESNGEIKRTNSSPTWCLTCQISLGSNFVNARLIDTSEIFPPAYKRGSWLSVANSTIFQLSKLEHCVNKYHICGNFKIFLWFRFYVKSISGILEVQNLPFNHI